MTTENDNKEPRTFTQDEVNTLIRERLQRATAKFADYDELKARAEAADAAGAAKQTEIEKLTAAVNKLTEDNARTAHEKLVADIAREHKITDADDIALFLTGRDAETLTKQAERLASRTEAAVNESRRQNLVVKTEGTPAQQINYNPSVTPEIRELAQSLFGGQDG